MGFDGGGGLVALVLGVVAVDLRFVAILDGILSGKGGGDSARGGQEIGS